MCCFRRLCSSPLNVHWLHHRRYCIWMFTDNAAKLQCCKTNFSESPIWIFDKTKMHKTMKTAQPTKRCSVAPMSHERIKRVCFFSGLVTLTRWVYLHSAVGVLEISLLFTSPKSKPILSSVRAAPLFCRFHWEGSTNFPRRLK